MWEQTRGLDEYEQRRRREINVDGKEVVMERALPASTSL